MYRDGWEGCCTVEWESVEADAGEAGIIHAVCVERNTGLSDDTAQERFEKMRLGDWLKEE